MQSVARFEKVSYEQFKKDLVSCDDCLKDLSDDDITKIYNGIVLPKRATKGSAGYDFFSPVSITLLPNQTIKIPTGIRCKIDEGYVLMLYPRSGLGFKYRFQLDNTVGVIDQDYYYSKNEGHIMAKLTNDTKDNKTVEISAGQGYMQGLFEPFYITYDDVPPEAVRDGGFGSTTI